MDCEGKVFLPYNENVAWGELYNSRLRGCSP